MLVFGSNKEHYSSISSAKTMVRKVLNDYILFSRYFLRTGNVRLFRNCVMQSQSYSAVHYVIWRDFFVQIELGVKIANLGGE